MSWVCGCGCVSAQRGVRLRVVLLGPQAPAPHAEGRDDDEPDAHQDVEERHYKDEDVHLWQRQQPGHDK